MENKLRQFLAQMQRTLAETPPAEYPAAFRTATVALALLIQRAALVTVGARFRRDLRGSIRNFCERGGTVAALTAELRDIVSGAVSDAYFAGLQEGGIDPTEFTEDDSAIADDLIFDQMEFVSSFANAIGEGCGDRTALYARADLWVASVNAAGQAGLNSAKQNEMVEFVLVGDPSAESCRTCMWLIGQRHRRKWVVEHGYEVKPGNTNFECENWRCPHDWRPVKG